MNLIVIKNLQKVYRNEVKSKDIKNKTKQILGLSSFSLEIEKPKIVGIFGNKNSGKTTLLKMCLGLIKPTSGDITILGTTPNSKNIDFLYMVGSANGLKISANLNLTSQESLLLSGYLYNLNVETTKTKITKLSKLFKFKSLLLTPLNQLSSVEKIKFELISTLIHSPKIIFVDNLIDELNKPALKEIQTTLIQYFEEEKICMLFTSSNKDNLENFCQEIVEI